jgi:hypothetical protein
MVHLNHQTELVDAPFGSVALCSEEIRSYFYTPGFLVWRNVKSLQAATVKSNEISHKTLLVKLKKKYDYR